MIEPLFLDDLRAELAAAKGNANKLFEFQKKLRTLTFLDPACGCGNFLVIAYRELRELELEILRQVDKILSRGYRPLGEGRCRSVLRNRDRGVPGSDRPGRLWLMDHQMNQRVSAEFGVYFARLPLATSPTIVLANALRIDWEGWCLGQFTHILGTLPLLEGGAERGAEATWGSLWTGYEDGVLDYVTAWFVKASRVACTSRVVCRVCGDEFDHAR